MIKVFCDIMQQYKRLTLFSVIVIITLMLLMVAEAFGLTSTTIDWIATSSISFLAIGLLCDAIQENPNL